MQSLCLFLRDCLTIPCVKVVFSLQADYLHYLQAVDRVSVAILALIVYLIGGGVAWLLEPLLRFNLNPALC